MASDIVFYVIPNTYYRSFSFVCGKVWWNVFDAWCLSAKLKLSDLKAFKVSINIFNVSCKRCTLLCYAKKDKYLLVFTFTSFFSPSLPNLAPQLRCAQNRYTAVQMDLKYPVFWKGLWFNYLISTLSL